MSEPIRILHVLQRMEAGGTQALLMNIYREIDRSKVQFDFLVEYEEKQFYDDEIEALGGKIFRTNFRENLNIISFTKYLNKFFKNHDEYHIVHVHTYSIGYFVLSAAKRAGVPIRIAHSHNNDTVRDYKYIPKLVMQRLYTKNATDLFACSNEAGLYLFGDKPFKVLKNVIDSSKFKFNEKKRKKFRMDLNLTDKFVVGNVGRLHSQKNQSFLIDIFKEIKVRKKNAILIIIGQGPLEQQLKRKVISLALSDSVIFLGNRKDMDYIYQSMDVFIFPSLFEGFGISAVEAQASGTPSVCSDRLPAEVEVTPLFKSIGLDIDPSVWAKNAIDFSNNSYRQKNMQKYIVEAGFDVKMEAQNLEKYYLDKYNHSNSSIY